MENVNLELKHDHHYVFQAYQKQWAEKKDEKCVWVSRDRGAPQLIGVSKNLFKKNFYKLQILNDVDKAFLEKWLKYKITNKAEIEEIDKHIAYTQLFFKDKKFFDLILEYLCSSNNSEIDSFTNSEFKEIGKILDSGIYNTEEEFHSQYETEGIEYIRKMISTEKMLETEEERHDFIVFISVQFFRTMKIYNCLAKFLDENINGLSRAMEIDLTNLNKKAVIPHIIWKYEMCLASSLINRNAHMTLLINDTSIPFVTSDQPIINIRENKDKELVLYYPLSPRFAVTVNDNNGDDKKNYTRGQNMYIQKYNELMAKEAEHVLISNKRSVLETIIEDL